MTHWLKWRLCALLGTSLLVGGATYLHAQGDYPAPAKTPEEAALSFFRLLDSVIRNPAAFRNDDSDANVAVVYESQNEAVDFGGNHAIVVSLKDGSISRAQFESFNTSPHQFKELIDLLFQEAHTPQYDARVIGAEGARTLVEVPPATRAKRRDVVVVGEDGGYRVDLKATFGRWNNLSGEKLDEAWFRYTGAVSPLLMQSDLFLRSQCQTRMKQQMLGMFQYAQDYDDMLPSARKWVEVLQPYVKSEQIFKCPAPVNKGYGYAYNQYLSQVSQTRIENVAATVNIYETLNPRRNWFGRGTGKAFRHQGGWNLAFADGHVKWFDTGEPIDVKFKPIIQAGAGMPSAPLP